MDMISFLPDENLIQILGYLSPKMIKRCSLVSERWNELIGRSKELMGKFQLNLSCERYEEAKELQRKHQNIMIGDLNSNCLEVMRLHNIHTLAIHHLDSLKLSELVLALLNLPRVKIIKAWEITFMEDLQNIGEFKKVRVNLEKLECVAEILHIFECSTLKVLRLLWNHKMTTERTALSYKFLSQQKDLKDFCLCEYWKDDFFSNSENYNFEFKLKSFKYFSPSTLEYYKFLIRFLWSQKESLTTLDVQLQPNDEYKNDEVQKFIMKNLSNLKDLSLDLTIKGDLEERTEAQLEMNEEQQATDITKNIERLSYKGLHRTLDESKRFIDLFPNIKHLNFETHHEEDFQLLKHVSMTNMNIESLEFLNFDNDFEASFTVYFPKLKELMIFDIADTEAAFSSFINRHSNTLEKITIRDTDEMTQLTANAIINCENLKYLSLGITFDLLPLMNLLHGLSFRTKPVTIIFGYYSFPFSVFKFPEDKVFWDEDIQQFQAFRERFLEV